MLGQRYVYDGIPLMDLSQRQCEARERVMKAGYAFEDFPCECGATEEAFEVLAEKDRYGLPSRTVICRRCGLVMTNPRMTQESYDDFYGTEYRKLYRDRDVPVAADFEQRVSHGHWIHDYVVEGWHKSIQSVLEIGCADGGNLYWFREHGYRVTGIDLDGEYIAYGQSQGLDLRQSHSSELVKENKKYDLIILNHVMEHFLTLGAELETIGKLLAEDGALYVEVPGVKNLEGTYNNDFGLYMQNAHVYCFTLGTLESVMQKYGFSLVTGDEDVHSLWQYTGKKKVIFDNYFCDIMAYLYQIERPREKAISNLRELGGAIPQLVSDMQSFQADLTQDKPMDYDRLRKLLGEVGNAFQIIIDATGVLNIDTEELEGGMTALSDAIDSGDVRQIGGAFALVVSVFERMKSISIGVKNGTNRKIAQFF